MNYLQKTLLCLICITFSGYQSVGQQKDTVVFNLATPFNTIASLAYYTNSEHYDSALVATAIEMDKADTSGFVRKLRQLIKGEGIFINPEKLPANSDYIDSISQRPVYYLSRNYPEIYLEKKDENWVIPKESVALTLELYSHVFQFGTDKLVEILNKPEAKQYFGLTANQYLSILVLMLISFLVHKFLSTLIGNFGVRLFKKMGRHRIAEEGIGPVAKPISLFFVCLTLSFFFPVLQLPANISFYVVGVLRAFLPFVATMVFYRLVNILSIYLERMALKTESTLDDQLIPIVSKTLRTFVVLIGTLVILDSLDVDILPLLTGLSIGGLAFALAAQDTIKNFFGSLMIFVDKPFQIGHWITSGDIDGTVEEVGFRSTRIRTFRNSVTYVPNGKLADATIDNHGLRMYRRFYTQISVTYDTSPELIEEFIEGLKQIVQQHPDTWKDNYHVYFNEMAAHSLNIMFYVFFSTPDWAGELKARHEILLEIMKLGKKLGVNFAFPTQTLHIESLPDFMNKSIENPT